MLTAVDLKEIRALVKSHMDALTLLSFGSDVAAIDPEDVRALVDSGILDPAAIGALDPVTDLYALGFLSRRIAEAGIEPSTLTIDAFRDTIAKNPMPLTSIEQAAIDYANAHAGQYAVGFGDARASDVMNAVLEDEARARIREQTAEAIAGRETPGALASRLGEVSQDWDRDWSRVAATEMQDAHNQGYADSMERDFGADVRVSMVTNPDACQKCLEMFLDGDNRPKVFRLSQLRANGTNKGRKQKEWLPTLGPLHPWCHCVPVYLPDGMVLDASFHLTRAPKETEAE
jgi:hypothetical protein